MADEADRIAFAATSLPAIVAVPVARWSVEDVADADPARRVQHIFEAAERIDAYAGLLAVLEYVGEGGRIDGEHGGRPDADAAVAQLRGRGPFTWGQWQKVRRACSRAFEANPAGMFCPNLFKLDDILSRVEGAGLLPKRNTIRHGVAGSREYDAEVEAECRDDLLWLLGAVAELLGDVRLVRVAGVGLDTSTLVVEDLTGSHAARPRVRRTDVRFHGRPPVTGDLAVLRPGREAGWAAMSLFPLYRWFETKDGGEVAQYSGRRKKLDYLGLRTGDAYAVAADARFDESLSRLPTGTRQAIDDVLAGASGWKPVLAGARAVSAELLRQVRKERVYVPEAFIERPQAGARIAQFLDAAVRGARAAPVAGKAPSAPRLLLLTGMAGAGKTSFLCHLAEALQQGWPLVPVVLVTAAALENLGGAGRGDAGRACLEWLEAGSPEEFGKQLGVVEGLSRQKRPTAGGAAGSTLDDRLTAGVVVLLVDGIDRAGDSDYVLARLHGIVTELPGFVCVATVARPILQGLAAGCAGWRALARFGDEVDDLAVSVGTLDEADGRLAWKGYQQQQGSCPVTEWDDVNPSLKAAARNPLLLRLACEAYHGLDIPKWANEVDILREHAHRYVWKDFRRARFVRALVAGMWGDGEHPVRRLNFADILELEHLREGALDPSGPLSGLERDHVLVRVPVSGSGPYDAPDYAVEFAFDALLGYLFFALVGKDAAGRASPDRRIMEFAAHSGRVAPLGYSMDLVLRSEFSSNGTGEGAWVGCVRLLLKQRGGVVPEPHVSCVTRFLTWINAQADGPRPPVEHARGPGSESGGAADDPFVLAQALYDDIERVYGDARAATEAEVAPARVDPARVIDAIFKAVGDEPWGLCGVADQLAERKLPLLAGDLARRLLAHAQGQKQDTTHTLTAWRLRAEAALREGSVDALGAVRSGLRAEAEKAKVMKNEDEYRKLQRLLARVYRDLDEVGEALHVVDGLLAEEVHTRTWKPDAYVENLLLMADLFLADKRDPEGARARVEALLAPLNRTAIQGYDGGGAESDGTPADRAGRSDLTAVCNQNSRLAAWRAEIESQIQPTEEWEFACLSRAAEGYQAIGATAEAARVLARRAEREYRADIGQYARAAEFGDRARALADAAGATASWIRAAEWEARALVRTSPDPTAAKAFGLAREALARALPLGQLPLLANALVAVCSTSTENSRHTIAARAQELVVAITRDLIQTDRLPRGELPYRLVDLTEVLIDAGRSKEAVEIGKETWDEAVAIKEDEKPWAAITYARAVAEGALITRTRANPRVTESVERLKQFESKAAKDNVRYWWQFARAEALTLAAAGEFDLATERLKAHADGLAEAAVDKDPGSEEVLGAAVAAAWHALLTATTNPAGALTQAVEAHRKLRLGRGLQHQPVASYAAALAHQKIYGESMKPEDKTQAYEFKSRAMSEVVADYPEIYSLAEGDASARDALKGGNLIVHCVMEDAGFPPVAFTPATPRQD